MNYKIAICKIHMIGSPALVLGIGRYCNDDPDDVFWQKFQLFTAEEYLNDKDEGLRKYATGRSKYHSTSVHFESIDRVVNIKQEGHDFDFRNAEAVELDKEDWQKLTKELTKDQWQDFDWETWGK